MPEIEYKIKNGSVLLDAADVCVIEGYKWYVVKAGPHRLYAAGRNQSGSSAKVVMMHRLITDCPIHMVVDHRNGYGLDNRRRNLRICTPSQNQWNRKKRCGGVSRFKGVFFDQRQSSWRARIKIHGKYTKLGSFATPEDAAAAYDAKARELFGQFACLNFPQSSEEGCLA